MSTIRCKSCGAPIPDIETEFLTCPYCGSRQKKKKGGIKKTDLTPRHRLFGFNTNALLMSFITTIIIAATIGVFYYFEMCPFQKERCGSENDIKILQDSTSKKIGLDLYHGVSWKNLNESINVTGFILYRIDGMITAKSLAGLRAILVFGTSGKSFSRSEICAISNFVQYGGSLIVAAQAWSWSYKEYGNKPNEDFPLNVLGRELGYRITEHNILAPYYLDDEMIIMIKKVNNKNWAPSRIELTDNKMRVFIRDFEDRIMAGSYRHGKGKVFVCGHDSMIAENPAMLKFFLTNLSD